MKFTGSATISRKDFGLRWHQETGTGGLIAGDQVDLEIAMTVHRAKR